jgi:glycosyltransferase involved in cell wall biosynthesis
LTKSDIFVSVVAPLNNDEAIAADFIIETIFVLKKSFSNYELVLVDDGSIDNTSQAVEELLKLHDCIRLIRLSRRFGIETAISAGLDSAIGDFVVVMIPNDDPPGVIPEMVSFCQNGPGVVTGVRPDRKGDPYWAKLGAKLFYLYAYRFLKINIPENSTPFRVLSRQAVNAITQIRDQYRYIRLISNFIGYAQVEFPYTPINRSGRKHGRSFWESANMALDIIVANSLHPLRVVTILGLFAGILNLLYISYIILVYLFKDKVAEGWVTTNFQSAVMFFFIFVILTVLSEYVGRIMNETRKRPLYYVLDELNSSVMLANSERRNIVGLE